MAKKEVLTELKMENKTSNETNTEETNEIILDNKQCGCWKREMNFKGLEEIKRTLKVIIWSFTLHRCHLKDVDNKTGFVATLQRGIGQTMQAI